MKPKRKNEGKNSGLCLWSHKRRWSTLRTRHIFPAAPQPGRGRSGIFSSLCGLLLKPRLRLESTGWRFWPGGILQANVESAMVPVDRRRSTSDSPVGPPPAETAATATLARAPRALIGNVKQLKVVAEWACHARLRREPTHWLAGSFTD